MFAIQRVEGEPPVGLRQQIKRAAIAVLHRFDPSLVSTLHAAIRQPRNSHQRLSELENAEAPQFVPPGHFYSPVPRLDEVRRRASSLYQMEGAEPPGIDMREEAQLALLQSFKPYYDEVTFPAERTPGLRYHYDNPAYGYPDAFFLHAMIRHLRPKRIIEVGSGYSSCMTLDTNERFFGNSIQCTFIEPYPKLLKELVKPEDKLDLISTGLQAVPLDRFRTLEAGDILFVDSTHVVRVGSDVNHLFFSILPALAKGVYVHLHDVFYPFEYPLPWLLEGRQWAELYLLRAFLMYNTAFEVALMNTFLLHRHRPLMEAQFPACCAEPFGSIWLRKV